VQDARVRPSARAEPTAEEGDAGRLACATDPAWRPEDNLVGEHGGEPVEIMGVEGLGLLFS